MEESNRKCDLAGDRGTTAVVIWHTLCTKFKETLIKSSHYAANMV